MSSVFSLANGRSVSLRGFSIDSTYDGVMEGSPETASAAILKQLQKEADKASTSRWPIVIVETDKMPLPSYLVTIKLHSSQGARKQDSDYSSQLICKCFIDSTAVSIDAIIERAIQNIDWEANAADYDMMDF